MKRCRHNKRSVAPDPGGDGYGYLRRRGLSQREIAKGHNQGVGHNSGLRDDDDGFASAMDDMRSARSGGMSSSGPRIRASTSDDDDDEDSP